MKKIIALFLAMVMMIGVSACAGTPEPSTAPSDNVQPPSTAATQPSSPAPSAADDEKTGNYTIAISLNALDEYQTEWFQYLKDYAESLGVTVLSTNAEGKVDKQLGDVESLIAQKPDVIVIRATDSEGVVPAFEACAAAGIPTVDSGFGAKYDDTLKILSSQFYLCSLQAQYCIQWLEDNPGKTLKAGYLWGVQGVSSTQERYDGWKKTLTEAYPDRVEILAEKVANWSAVDSMAAVEDWMQAYPEMNCIVAMSDEMALAATNVLQAAGKGLDECIVVGIDGSPNAQQALRDGTLSATVYTSKRADAQLTIDYALRLAGGEELKGQVIDPGDEISALMTKDNIDEVLEKLH